MNCVIKIAKEHLPTILVKSFVEKMHRTFNKLCQNKQMFQIQSKKQNTT